MTAWIQKLQRLKAERAAQTAEPLRVQVEAAVKGKESISSVALLDLLDMPKTVGSARRVAAVMRELNFIPIRNRQLVPGGFRDTVCRGWARPIRGSQSNPGQDDRIASSPPWIQAKDQQEEQCHVQ